MSLYIQELSATAPTNKSMSLDMSSPSILLGNNNDDDIGKKAAVPTNSSSSISISTSSTTTAKRKSYAPPFHPSNPSKTTTTSSTNTELLKPLELTPLQASLINDTMKDLKERAAKRQKKTKAMMMMMMHHLATDSCHLNHQSSSTTTTTLGNNTTTTTTIDILDKLDSHPDIIQTVATSGGLITHWNEAFTKITKPSSSLQTIPLTIFELVDAKYLHSLYSMLALALHNIGIVEVENCYCHCDKASNDDDEDDEDDEQECSTTAEEERVLYEEEMMDKSLELSSSHLSITLPCRMFRDSSTRYNITVIFMNGIASMKRCFLGIITPRSEEDEEDDEDDNNNDFLSTTTSHNNKKKKKTTPHAIEDTNGEGCVGASSSSSSSPRRLPIGRILRVDDEYLCQMLLGSTGKHSSVE